MTGGYPSIDQEPNDARRLAADSAKLRGRKPIDRSVSIVQREPSPRVAVAVLVFELAALALLMWLAMAVASCSVPAPDSTRQADVYNESP